MAINNFESARTRRRRMIKLLRDQQRLDSSCSERLRVRISSHTREILQLISAYLMSLTAENITPRDQSVFVNLVPSWLTMEGWFQLRKDEASAADELARLTSLVKAAEAEYDQLAPLGYLSGMFSNEAEKQRIGTSRFRRNSLRTQRDSAEKEHQHKLQAVQASAKVFLSNAMSPEGLRVLLTGSSIGDKLQETLSQMNKEVTGVWISHIQSQTESLEKVRSATADLFAIYECADLSESTPLLKGKHA
jgi:hypothetical protein